MSEHDVEASIKCNKRGFWGEAQQVQEKRI
jgi:hypothetical protein